MFESFKQSVDANSAPNGRQQDFCGPTYFFSSQFSPMKPYAASENVYEPMRPQLVVSVFDKGKGRRCSEQRVMRRLTMAWEDRNVGICRIKTRYCTLCKELKTKQKSLSKSLNRMREYGNALARQIQLIKEKSEESKHTSVLTCLRLLLLLY